MRRLIVNAKIRRFLSAQAGATAVEYSIIAAGIAGALVAAIATTGGSVTRMWNSVAAIF